MKKFTQKTLSKFDKIDKEQSKKLLESTIEYTSMLENILDKIERGLILIKDNKILYSNNNVESLIKIDNKVSSIDSYFLDPDIQEFVNSVLKKEDLEQKDFTYSVGSKFKIISILVSKLQDDNSRIIEVKDVSIIREKDAKQRRNEQLASFTTMAAAVAHEIKNPLTSILLYIQLLEKQVNKKNKLDKKDADKYLSVLQNEIHRLNTIVVDFLFAVKPMNAKFSKLDINSVLNEIVDFVKKEASDNNCIITCKLQPYLPKIDIDESLLKQAILNIIKNSISAIDKKKGEIIITTSLEHDNIILSIEDNGKGMSDDVCSKIFEPYFTTKETGTGLGLTVVYKIIKEHSGDIYVKSKENKGTEFTLVFPIESSNLHKLEHRG